MRGRYNAVLYPTVRPRRSLLTRLFVRVFHKVPARAVVVRFRTVVKGALSGSFVTLGSLRVVMFGGSAGPTVSIFSRCLYRLMYHSNIFRLCTIGRLVFVVVVSGGHQCITLSGFSRRTSV